MRKISTLIALFLFLAISQAVPANVKSSLSVDDLIRLRCSHNPDEETYFFFNGTVTAYLGRDTGGIFSPSSSIQPLFNAVGINVARCYKNADGVWYLVGREAMWYVDRATDTILSTWKFNNPTVVSETVNVVHVDNDPVMQTFNPNLPGQGSFPAMVYGEETILPSDVTQPLNYLNPIQSPRNPTFDPYSPQQYYQASELFKFISPTADVFSDKDTVDRTIVSWTRTSLFLPWMKMGNTSGYLLYSFQGSKIPDYTYLPPQIRADIENRVPHYKHAPPAKCFPSMAGSGHSVTGGVTSWSFFKENFQNYLDGVQFPLATPRTYGCSTAPAHQPAADTTCKAVASLTYSTSWQSNGQTVTQYDIKLTNTGSKAIKTAAVEINFANVVNSWNVQRQGQTNVYDLSLWNNINVGSSVSGAYGIQVTGSATVSVASVTCA
jgi:hypothetical protein